MIKKALKLILTLPMAISLFLTVTYTNNDAIAQLNGSPETPPLAIAGPNQTIVSGTTARLNGSGSFDLDGDRIIKYNWSGPDHGFNTLILNTTSPTPSFVAPPVKTPTDLTFTLTVNDGKHDSMPAHAVVHVIPKGTVSSLNYQNNTAYKLNNVAPVLQSNNLNTLLPSQQRNGNMNQRSNLTYSQIIPFIPSSPTTPPSPASRQISNEGFTANGTIDSIIFAPKTKWIATGNWSMAANNGRLTAFVANMTWYNNNGTASHTHELQNLIPTEGKVRVQPDNSIFIKGLMDVGTNHRVTWRNVHSTVDIKGGKTITISVDDRDTNNHFAGQPVYGVVTSLTPCSDIPGPNMEVLPPCTSSSGSS